MLKLHTSLSATGGCHCLNRPLDPTIECFKSVSSLGRGRVTDLYERASTKPTVRFREENNRIWIACWKNFLNPQNSCFIGINYYKSLLTFKQQHLSPSSYCSEAKKGQRVFKINKKLQRHWALQMEHSLRIVGMHGSRLKTQDSRKLTYARWEKRWWH